MKAVILAAGRGSRMGGLTDEKPKCLVEVRGKALLDWQLLALREAGIEEIGIVTGYRRDLLADRGLREFHNPRWAETNMVGSLEAAQEWLGTDTCIVSYSDIYYGTSAVQSLIDCDAHLAVTYDPNWLPLWTQRFGDPLLDAETFRLSSSSGLIEIGQKPRTVEEIEGQYMGLLRFTPEGWAQVAKLRAGIPTDECDRMHMTGMLQLLIEGRSLPVLALPYVGEWGEFDSATDLDQFDS